MKKLLCAVLLFFPLLLVGQIRPDATLKSYFQPGSQPTNQQMHEFIDSKLSLSPTDGGSGILALGSVTAIGGQFVIIADTDGDMKRVDMSTILGGTAGLGDLTDVTITAPAVNQVLTWTGAQWVNQAPSGGGTPGGSDTEMQYNNSGAFGGSTMVFDGANHQVTSGTFATLNGGDDMLTLTTLNNAGAISFGGVGNPAPVNSIGNSTDLSTLNLNIAGLARFSTRADGSTINTFWSDGGTVFDGLEVDAVDSASDAASTLLSLRISDTSVFDVRKDGAMILADGVRQTFNPDATNSGLNVGSLAGDPSSPSDGDLWYDSTANQLTARINGADVALGAGGGGGTPGGANESLQFNNSGAFGGANVHWDGTNIIPIGVVDVGDTSNRFNNLNINGAFNVNGALIYSDGSNPNNGLVLDPEGTGNVTLDNGDLVVEERIETASGRMVIAPFDGTLVFGNNYAAIAQVGKYMAMDPDGYFGWADLVNNVESATKDTRLYRNQAGDVGLQHGTPTSSAAFNIYNTSDGGSAPVNFEALTFDWSSDVARVFTQVGGTGVARALEVGTTANLNFNSAGSSINFRITSANRMILDAAQLRPAIATMNLGTSSSEWQDLFLSRALYHGTTAGITASVTQTQGQQPLTTDINQVSTVANSGDVVTLPTAAEGRAVTVINDGANLLQIFPDVGDDLGNGVDTSMSLTAGEEVTFFAYDATNWKEETKGSGGGGTPGGSNTEIQYNNSGAFGGSTLQYDGTDITLASGDFIIPDRDGSSPTIRTSSNGGIAFTNISMEAWLGGQRNHYWLHTGFQTQSGNFIGWSAGASDASTAADALLYRNQAGDIGLQHGTPTSSAAFNVYNTSDGGSNPTNYEALTFSWSSNVGRVETTAGGTGSNRELRLAAPARVQVDIGGSGKMRWDSSGTTVFDGLIFSADNTHDIGASGATRPRNLYIGTSIHHGTTAGITASTTQTQGQGALTKDINEVSIVANGNDTVTLPTATAGLKIIVINNGANTLQIFPASGDDLGSGVDTATTLASGSNVTYVAYDATNWESI